MRLATSLSRWAFLGQRTLCASGQEGRGAGESVRSAGAAGHLHHRGRARVLPHRGRRLPRLTARGLVHNALKASGRGCRADGPKFRALAFGNPPRNWHSELYELWRYMRDFA